METKCSFCKSNEAVLATPTLLICSICASETGDLSNREYLDPSSRGSSPIYGSYIRDILGVSKQVEFGLNPNSYNLPLSKYYEPLVCNIETYRKLPEGMKILSVPSKALNYVLNVDKSENTLNILSGVLKSTPETSLIYCLLKKERLSKEFEKEIIKDFKNHSTLYPDLRKTFLSRYVELSCLNHKECGIFKEGAIELVKSDPLIIIRLIKACKKRILFLEKYLMGKTSLYMSYTQVLMNWGKYSLKSFDKLQLKFENFVETDPFIKEGLEKIKDGTFRKPSHKSIILKDGVLEKLKTLYSEDKKYKEVHEKLDIFRYKNYTVSKSISDLSYDEELIDFCIERRKSRWEYLEPLIKTLGGYRYSPSLKYCLHFGIKDPNFPSLEGSFNKTEVEKYVLYFYEPGVTKNFSKLEKLFEKDDSKSLKFTESLLSYIRSLKELSKKHDLSEFTLTKGFEENVLANNIYEAIKMAEVLKRRIPAAEPKILLDPIRKSEYLNILKQLKNDREESN